MPLDAPMPMFTMPRLLTTTVVLASVFALSQAAHGQDATKRGMEVYNAQKCQTCHAIGGKGSKANPLDGVGAKLSADDIKQWITHPTDAAAKAKSTKKPP